MAAKRKTTRRFHPHPTLILAFLALLIAAGAVTYHNLRRELMPVAINEVNHSTGQVTLALSPVSLTTTPGQEQVISLIINTNGAKVTAIKGELAYDTGHLTTPILTQGSFLTEKLKDSSVGSGKISFVYAAPPDSGGKTGTGTLATIKIKPTVSGDTRLVVTSGTEVAALGYTTKVLKSATDSLIQVTAVAASSSPLASASPTASPHASSSPAASHLASPVSSASPAASSRASASPSASASPAASPAAIPSPSSGGTSVITAIKDFFSGNTSSPTPAPSETPEMAQIAAKPTFTEFVFGGTKTAVDETTGEEVAVREPNIFERIVSFFRTLFGLTP